MQNIIKLKIFSFN